MNKKIVFGILSAFVFNISAVNFVKAQDFNIPPPSCVSTPEIPCPGDKIDKTKIQKPTSPTPPALGPDTNNSKTLENLMTNMNKLIADLKNKLEDIVNKFGQFFDGIKKMVTGSKK